MSGFLYDIQGYFKATYSGRYLAFILTELYRQDREAFIRILNEAGINYIHKTGDRAVANCWPFPIATQLRFADIAILNAADDPIVLVEIKDADINNEGNTAQLDHYLKFIGNKKNRNVEFLFLSRTVPPEKDEQKLQTARSKKRVHQMFFRQLHNPLRGSKVFGKMLMDYLEGINVAYFERRPDQNTIRYVTNSMLGIGGQKVIEKSMPEFYQIAFGNLSSLGLWIQNNNPKLFKRGFKRRLYVEPWHDVRRLKADITAKSQKKAAALMKDESLDEYCKGGKVYIYTCGYLTHKNGKVYLEFGYWLEAEQKSTKPFTYKHKSGIYANILWKPWKYTSVDYIEESDTLKKFPDEEVFQKALRGFLKRTKATALARKSCPNDVKGVLRTFIVP